MIVSTECADISLSSSPMRTRQHTSRNVDDWPGTLDNRLVWTYESLMEGS
jgi:hypothetical protein